MRFHRQRRFEIKGPTPRRLSAARRAVERDRDSWALFPEKVRHQSAEERVAATDAGLIVRERENRAETARAWRFQRARLARLPEPLRGGVLAYWNRHGWLPGDPTYLGGLLHEVEQGRFDPVLKSAEIERCRLLGIVSREVMEHVRIPDWPLDRHKDWSELRMAVAGEIARARAPHLFLAKPDDPSINVWAVLL